MSIPQFVLLINYSKLAATITDEKHTNFRSEDYVFYLTRPSCALDRRSILCLYVPGFQRQVFKYVSNCKWIPLTNFSGFRVQIPVT